MEEVKIIKKPTYDDKQKARIYKWRSTHKEQHNKYLNEWGIKNYHNHAEEYRKKRVDRYYYQKECKRFRDIDLF